MSTMIGLYGYYIHSKRFFFFYVKTLLYAHVRGPKVRGLGDGGHGKSFLPWPILKSQPTTIFTFESLYGEDFFIIIIILLLLFYLHQSLR